MLITDKKIDLSLLENPSSNQENWRFTPVRKLKGLYKETVTEESTHDLSYNIKNDENVERKKLSRNELKFDQPFFYDVISASSFNHVKNLECLTISEDSIEPLEITLEAKNDICFGGLKILIKDNVQAKVIIRYIGKNTISDNIFLEIKDHAKLEIVVLSDVENTAKHIGVQNIFLHTGSKITHNLIQTGGELVRISPVVHYLGSYSDAELNGLYIVDSGNHFEQKVLVNHEIPNCKSRVNYRGVLFGNDKTKDDAHNVWISDVVIGAEAQGTDTYEISRNLILSEGARADAVPNLEIKTGDIVGAGHAATVGRFDEEQIFYLNSRGINPDEAKRIVVIGFLYEIINTIPFEQIKTELQNKIEQVIR